MFADVGTDQNGRKKIVLTRRSLPKINDQGKVVNNTITIEVRKKRLVVNQNAKLLTKVVKYYILLEDHHGDLPDNITVLRHHGRLTMPLNGQMVSGECLHITAVGQAVHDWVEKIGPIWLSLEKDSQWVKAKAA